MRANLRAHYYASLGFQGAELKPALETILKENVVELKKISKICISYALPPEYRAVIWKLLLASAQGGVGICRPAKGGAV